MPLSDVHQQAGGDALLVALDALVRMDDGPPGFGGSLAVGVRRPGGEVWWHATFAAKATTSFSTEPPSGPLDVRLLLGEREAINFLTTGSFGDAPVTAQLEGNPKIFERLVERYFRVASMVDVRANRNKRSR